MIFLGFIVICVVLWIIIDGSHRMQREENMADNNGSSHILNGFKSDLTKVVSDYSFLISEEEKKVAIRYDGGNIRMNPVILKVDNITNLEITQDDQVVQSGGISRAIVGGFLAGGVGAIVGSNTAKQTKLIKSIWIKFTTNDISNPVIRLQLYGDTERISGVDPNSKYNPRKIYDELENLIAILGIIKDK